MYKQPTQIDIVVVLSFIITAVFSSCEKLVSVDPPINKPTGGNLYTTNAGAISAVTGMYAKAAGNNFLESRLFSLSLYAGVLSDELTQRDQTQIPLLFYYTNNLSPATIGTPGTLWKDAYQYIFQANSAIEALQTPNGVSSPVKQQLLGEAKFVRAFCYFYLVNLYGDVPLVLTTDYKLNERMSRTAAATVTTQMITDLEESRELLAVDFLDATLSLSSPERIRPTRWAASALLARAFLYNEQWQKAADESSKLIDQTALFSIQDIQDAFKKNNPEAIFQIQSIVPSRNTQDAWVFILQDRQFDWSHPVTLSSSLVTAFSPNDARLSNWIGMRKIGVDSFYYANKYKKINESPVSEYQTVFRLAEQYLIRAEAKAQLNQLDGPQGAVADLDKIRKRAGLTGYAGMLNKDSILKAILQERQLELFTEWGHRWFDLKRTKTIDQVMNTVTPQKGGTWSSFRQLLPISNDEISYNNNLKQNPGY